MRVRLSAEYNCHPLWIVETDGLDNVRPKELGLSEELCRAIERWDEAYQRTFVPDDPVSSDFATAAEERAFEEEGVLLRARLQEELGDGSVVES